MSIDISRLGAHLGDTQRADVQAQYERNAKSPTAAFLLCFFLGIFGAHRFYLGQIGAGLLRLILSPLIIPGIIWEVYDLLHIDDEVNARNLTLAERLIAQAALAAPIPAAVAARTRAAEPLRAGQPATTVITPISGEPAAPAEPAITAPTVTPAPASAPEDDAPPIWPVAPELATDAATLPVPEAALPATPARSEAALTDETDETDETDDATLPTAADTATDITPEMVLGAAAIADAAAPIAPGQAAAFAPSVDPIAAETIMEAPPPATTPDALDALPDALPLETLPLETLPLETLPEAPAPAVAPRRRDPTDRGPDTGELLALADLGEVTGERVVVRLPSAAPAPAPAAPDWTDMPLADSISETAPPEVAPAATALPADAEPVALPLAGDAAALLLVPEEPASMPPAVEPPPAYEAPAVAEGSADPAPATGTAETQVSEEALDRFTDTGSHRIVKRVKVVRRLVVNGQVVEEATAEQVVDADADTSATARSLQESLRGNDFQQRIAALSTPITPSPATDMAGATDAPAPSDQPATPADPPAAPPSANG